MGDRRPKIEERLLLELVLIGGLVLLALAQTTLIPRPLGIAPPLMLVVVVCRTLIGMEDSMPDNSLARSLRWAFYGGIALDICAATPLGSHAIALLLASMMVMLLANRLRIGRALLPLLAVLLATVLYEATLGLFYHVLVAPLDWSQHMLVIVLPSVLFALIPALPVFYLLRWRYQSDLVVAEGA